MEISFIEIVMLMIGFYVLVTVMKLDGRVKGIKYTLDQISKQTGIAENPINNELRELISQGDDVKAVKKARETLGLSLVEGKQYIDALKLDKNQVH